MPGNRTASCHVVTEKRAVTSHAGEPGDVASRGDGETRRHVSLGGGDVASRGDGETRRHVTCRGTGRRRVTWRNAASRHMSAGRNANTSSLLPVRSVLGCCGGRVFSSCHVLSIWYSLGPPRSRGRGRSNSCRSLRREGNRREVGRGRVLRPRCVVYGRWLRAVNQRPLT